MTVTTTPKDKSPDVVTVELSFPAAQFLNTGLTVFELESLVEEAICKPVRYVGARIRYLRCTATVLTDQAAVLER